MTTAGPTLRRTRQQRTTDSRQRILDAAVACLVEHGYSATTTIMIQARADVSRGRLLHHFPSRDVLLVAAAQHLAASRIRQADPATLTAALDDGPDRWDDAIELLWESFHEPHFWAAAELWMAARTNAGLRDILLPEERALGVSIRESIDGMFGAEVAGHPLYPQFRELLFTSMRGVALTYAFDRRHAPSDPHLTLWKDMARRMLA